tara:strand:- start:59 stop:268 length:210 start_codon:yes stop_codon:yes gene_type:complete
MSDSNDGLYLTAQETALILFGKKAEKKDSYRRIVIRLCNENQLEYIQYGRRKLIARNSLFKLTNNCERT